MRAAPAVQVELPADPGWHRLLALLGAAAAAGVAAWGVQQLELYLLAQAGAALAGAAAGAWLGPHLAPQPAGRLAWDGQVWHWSSARAGRPASEPLGVDRIAIAIDLGAWMLLRLHGGAGVPDWLALSQARAGASWRALRTALRAPPPVEAAAADAPSAETVATPPR